MSSPPVHAKTKLSWLGHASLAQDLHALFNHEELERLRGQELNDPYQKFLWRLCRLGVINPKAANKPMDASTRSMRHSSAIGMRLWKMWKEAEG